jgi:hypothetical protein
MINYPRNCPRSLTQFMGPADADVVEPAVVAEGDFAIGVDAVRADAVVGVGVAAVVGAGLWAASGRWLLGWPGGAVICGAAGGG